VTAATELSEDQVIVLALLAGATAPVHPKDYLLGRPSGDGRTRAHKRWTNRVLELASVADGLLELGCADVASMDGHPNPNGYGWGYVITDVGRVALVRHVTGLTGEQIESAAVWLNPLGPPSASPDPKRKD
jgi:hypothetical protein